MRTLQVFRALGPVDARSASRDSLLRWIVFFVPFFGLLTRFATPVIAEWLDARLGFDLVPGVRSLFAKHTMGLAGRLPRLSRGVPLS